MPPIRRSLLAAALGLGAFTTAQAAPKAADPADRAVQAIVRSPAFKTAVATLDAQHDRTVADIVTLTEIPAPPFKEAAKGKAFAAMLKAEGLTDVETDPEGNVMGLRRGTGPAGGPVVVLAAHQDTVFPEGTPVKVRREGTKLYAPGVGDDSRSLAVLLAYVRALDAAKIKTRSDILFVGDVGEEGPGDLRGMRYLFGKGKYKDRIKAFFSMDGNEAARVTFGAVGSRRYRVAFHGPGGHSYGAFGIVNPMAAMGRAVDQLYAVKVPAKPRTTYSASVVGGGVSVNSIPADVWLEVDMRSESKEELARLDARFQEILKEAAEHENAARDTRVGKVTATPKLIGERPTGATSEDALIVRTTAAAARAAGYTPEFGASSTDSNIPISLGIPAVTIGSGGTGGRAHSLDEWIDVAKPESVRGMTVGLAALLATAGV
ncbi:M20/M25/M40 family metallo-hydrolase [Phenylobacterium sp.]|jgi:acetylornithine deacetylase/succinyl-diaminopimelate desuccinylase-like protein|uniref:M20/M25/M40 family metallo-hydrolase n=1 Tax=Phenylobacterium sp. TaxID=1871053 RepID=UPI002E3022C1|nr:M20/M25/M40 family metallo-hydrolase [Phenylobacterium sp.]HEX4710952.1 M20/M25/M40 family metallo-hydrolase [Phenylobacterium sp.]